MPASVRSSNRTQHSESRALPSWSSSRTMRAWRLPGKNASVVWHSRAAPVSTTSAVRLVQVLAAQRAAADRHTRTVGVDHQLLATETVVAFGTADGKIASAVQDNLVR